MNKSFRSIMLTGALMAGLAAAPGGFAEESADIDRGRELAYTCMGCHGISGLMNAYPAYHVPKIGGQNAEYIVIALKAYASGERNHPTMQAQGGSLSEDEMRDIAAYFQTARR